jgi:hypothetical protein
MSHIIGRSRVRDLALKKLGKQLSAIMEQKEQLVWKQQGVESHFYFIGGVKVFAIT